MDQLSSITFTVHIVSSCFMLGLIWFVQIVHYPLFSQVGGDSFSNYEKLHCKQTGYIVGPIMSTELITGIALIFVSISVPQSYLLLNIFLLCAIWFSTIFLQTPAHLKLTKSFDSRVHQSLVKLNWLRTFLWSGRVVLLGLIIFTLFKTTG